MVHVPFFNVDLPEPKLAAIIPNTISAALGATAQAIHFGKDLLNPPSPDDLKAFEQSFEATIPREFDRVRKRYAEGNIVNDEQLSSELEDAAFDWYRRQLRTSVIGATDEEMEDVAARKLGLARPSLQAALQERCLTNAVAAAGGIDLEGELRDAAQFLALRAREEEQRRQLAERRQRLTELRRQVRPMHRQAITTLSNASGGLLLGALLFKSALLATRRILRRGRKPQQRPPPPQQRRPTLLPPASVGAAAAASPRAASAAAAAAQQVPARQAAAPQAQAQRQQQQDKGTAAAAAGPSAARKPRAVKKR